MNQESHRLKNRFVINKPNQDRKPHGQESGGNRNESPNESGSKPRTGKGGEQRSESRPPTSPTTLLMILALIAVVAWLLSAALMPVPHSEVSYTYFRKLLDGVDFAGNPIKTADGKQVTNSLGKGPDGVERTVPSNILEVKRSGLTLQAFCQVAPPPEPKPAAASWYPPIGQGDKPLEPYIRVTLDTSDLRDAELNRLLADRGVRVLNEKPTDSSWLQTIFILGITVLMIALMWFMLRRTQSQMFGGGGFLSSFSKSTAKKFEADDRVTTFADVAGADGVKAELEEIVDFLKSPDKYQRLGGNVPKGVLLNGPPGTGKTLLAKAVAGEANAPFYSVNGSEFIQMFVGVGASRVRDLFQNAKETAPSIIFIDEIDAVGRQRGAGLGGGHDEREQTLNQILSEMDGFGGGDSVIVIAATNRPDVLDPALLRPGRFDRHITVNRPTRDGRLAIFKVHVKKVPLGEDVDLGDLASSSAGMTGADIKNLVNEAALHAAREGCSTVNKRSFSYALDRVRMGPRREEILNPENKEKTAYHEAGHTLAAWLLPKANPVSKVTVIPRGRSLGQTFMSPAEDRLDYSRSEMEQLLVVMLAGRSAEKLVYKEMSAGAQQDLEQATSLARRMVTAWGMSEKLGPVSFKLSDDDPFLGREMHQARQFSEHTLEVIDEEITKILRTASDSADKLLESEKDKLEAITRALIEKEELDHHELVELIGPSAQTNKPFLLNP
ncbi:MAG: ATP-dependent zinc metalloprotease FtsH [Planctomycetaceae bacterium]|nr:ATP-dependent zinc metalloprotease FtsH [Planctomycetaceae bacterium]